MRSDIKQKGLAPNPSGRFLLRMDPALHERLREEARGSHLSMNEYCVRKLASPGSLVEGPGSRAVEQARVVAGDALVGVVVFGSWARREARPDSDVDLLIVLDGEVPIRRELYRRWDREPVAWEGHPLEPHFVHLPEAKAEPGLGMGVEAGPGAEALAGVEAGTGAEPGGDEAEARLDVDAKAEAVGGAATEASPTGLWAEVAVEGLVLFEKDLRVSRYLAQVRAHLASGRMVRREIHGQAYWVGEP